MQPAVDLVEAREISVDPGGQSGEAAWNIGIAVGGGQLTSQETAVGGNVGQQAAEGPEVLVTGEFEFGEVDLDPLLVEEERRRHRQRNGECHAKDYQFVPEPG